MNWSDNFSKSHGRHHYLYVCLFIWLMYVCKQIFLKLQFFVFVYLCERDFILNFWWSYYDLKEVKIIVLKQFLETDHPFSLFIKCSKINISYWHVRLCAYQMVRNVGFFGKKICKYTMIDRPNMHQIWFLESTELLKGLLAAKAP